jgi:O-succinylbenzoate synthase
VTPPVVARSGVVQVPASAGLGYAVDTELIAANTISSVAL